MTNNKRQNDPAEWACLTDEQRDIVKRWSDERERKLCEKHEERQEKESRMLTTSGIFGLFIFAVWYELLNHGEINFLVFLLNVAARWLILTVGFILTASSYHYFCTDTDLSLWQKIGRILVFFVAVFFMALFLYNKLTSVDIF